MYSTWRGRVSAYFLRPIERCFDREMSVTANRIPVRLELEEAVGPMQKQRVSSLEQSLTDEENFDEIKSEVLAKLTLSVGKDPSTATDRDWFVAAALTARDRVIYRWLASSRTSRGKGRKRVYYLSL